MKTNAQLLAELVFRQLCLPEKNRDETLIGIFRDELKNLDLREVKAMAKGWSNAIPMIATELASRLSEIGTEQRNARAVIRYYTNYRARLARSINVFSSLTNRIIFNRIIAQGRTDDTSRSLFALKAKVLAAAARTAIPLCLSKQVKAVSHQDVRDSGAMQSSALARVLPFGSPQKDPRVQVRVCNIYFYLTPSLEMVVSHREGSTYSMAMAPEWLDEAIKSFGIKMPKGLSQFKRHMPELAGSGIATGLRTHLGEVARRVVTEDDLLLCNNLIAQLAKEEVTIRKYSMPFTTRHVPFKEWLCPIKMINIPTEE